MRARGFGVAAAVALWSGAAAGAHEIGTTRVSVVFHQGRTYEIEIVTDAASLAEKVAAVRGLPAPGNADPAVLQRVLESGDGQFRKRVGVFFGASEAAPAITYAVAPGSGPGAAAATIRMTGEIQGDARTFSWSYGWTFASYALTIRSDVAAAPATQWLEGGQRSAGFPLTAAATVTGWGTVWRYLTLGFTHIVPNGLDHMLFVLGIYLLSGRARPVLLQVSAFTVAHSITLGLSLYGAVAAPSRIVEPLIAVSIAYVAIENVFLAELKRRRVALVFLFGLLHGMGFAGALKDLGLPRSEFLTALVTFNVGVETGQLAVIGAAFVLVGWQWSNRSWYRNRIVVPASAAIGCLAVYWTVERLWF